MNSSTIPSSSAVVTPGRTCSARSACASATIAPACCMTSSSAADFRRIIAGSRRGDLLGPPDPLHRTAARMSGFAASCGPRRSLLERLLDLGEHPVHGLVGVDPDEVALRAVVADQRLRLAVIQLQPLRDRLGCV